MGVIGSVSDAIDDDTVVFLTTKTPPVDTFTKRAVTIHHAFKDFHIIGMNVKLEGAPSYTIHLDLSIERKIMALKTGTMRAPILSRGVHIISRV